RRVVFQSWKNHPQNLTSGFLRYKNIIIMHPTGHRRGTHGRYATSCARRLCKNRKDIINFTAKTCFGQAFKKLLCFLCKSQGWGGRLNLCFTA
ncbi:MAG TPA: hypothetical protein DIV41_02780, partial [Ruminococcaceae bacterium]|nr:hypothetical protein [Oscillospiraceae bacterium]